MANSDEGRRRFYLTEKGKRTRQNDNSDWFGFLLWFGYVLGFDYIHGFVCSPWFAYDLGFLGFNMNVFASSPSYVLSYTRGLMGAIVTYQADRKERGQRPTKSEGCTPNNGQRSMKVWLEQLTAAMRETKLNPPNNIAAEMVALLNRHSETNLIMSKLQEDSHMKAESAPCVIGSSHTNETDKATTGCADISETKIPKWMPLLFRPPSTMSLCDTEAEIAPYIFMASDKLSSKEILVKSLDGLAVGDRQTLMTLMPTSYVCNEVIMMERVLKEKNTTAEISKDYRNPFMGFVDKIKKIFIPIYDEGLHWYLVVIDMVDKKLWLLDSNPFPLRNSWRRLNANKIAVFFHEMLMDRTFYELRTTECPEISEFPLILPNGLSNKLTSFNDRGVQVAKWMMECISHDNYQSIGVNAESRIRLALDLVLNRNNQIRKVVMKNAYEKFKLFTQEWNITDDF
ncbi:Ulp1 protease family, C-terminal catalytic domain [Sesbania bispinosa]|nr:Ulp1 protease family, C-terminal catalytic domain [Sesbania bispinosa]